MELEWDYLLGIVIAICITVVLSMLVYNIRIYTVEYLKAGYVMDTYQGPKR